MGVQIAMLEKKVRIQKRQLSVFNTTAKSGSYNEELDDLDKEDGNRQHSTSTRQGKSNSSNKT